MVDIGGLFIRDGSSSLSVRAADKDVFISKMCVHDSGLMPRWHIVKDLVGCADDTAAVSSHSAPHSTTCLKERDKMNERVPLSSI